MTTSSPDYIDTASLSPDERAILAIEQEMASAQAVEGITRTWDDNVVYFDILQREIIGSEGATTEIANQFTVVTNLRTKILRLTIHADGNIGYAISIQNFISDGQGDFPDWDFIFRETDIFEKKDGEWRLTHQHLSVPADIFNRTVTLSNEYSPVAQ